jgi:ADP-ribosylglycohydrolase
MIGSIIGDIAGAPYEMDKLTVDSRDYRPLFQGDLSKFTDDTNLTIAVADAILSEQPFREKILEWYKKNPDRGYGSGFKKWAEAGGKTVNASWANGAAMRVSPIALFASGLLEADEREKIVPQPFASKMVWAMEKTYASVFPTHNTGEARRGAGAIVMASLMASERNEEGRVFDKHDIRDTIQRLFKYELLASIDHIREYWDKRNIRCNITVPQALICFLESENFDDCIRAAVYTKGDTDTIAAMAGGIAENYYGVESINKNHLKAVKTRLQPEMIDIINKCYARVGKKLTW